MKSRGFAVGENVFWPGPSGTISLFWSMPKDFQSTSGVDASIFPLDREGKKVWDTANNWALRTRTSIWATSFDQEFQNSTVRQVRRSFGGRFLNDREGWNRYIVVRRHASSPASRGVYAVLTRVLAEMDSLEYALPAEKVFQVYTPGGTITEENDPKGIVSLSKRLDPDRVVFNALVPFLVASVEHFFRESFEILLKYDGAALRKIVDGNTKVPFSEVASVQRGELSLEEIVSRRYCFQNINSIQSAFKEVLEIDVLKSLQRRSEVRRRRPILHRFLVGLIERRHKVIHHFSLDRELGREEFLDHLEGTRTLLQYAAGEIERKLGVKLGPG